MNKFFIRIILIFLVGLSFFLSFGIWTNNGSSNRNTLIANKSVTQVDYSRDLSNLYNPIKIFSVDENGNKFLLPGRINTVTKQVKKHFKKLDFRRMSKYQAETDKQYEGIINNNETIQLYYQSPLSIKVLSQTFGFKFDKKVGAFPVNRIIIGRVSPIESEIYFANDQNHSYYYLNLTFKRDRIFSVIQNAKQKIEVKEEKNGTSYLTYFQKSLPLNSYVYLVKTLDDSFYVSSFMTNDGSVGLTFDSKNNIYKKGLTRYLSINEKTGVVHFMDYHVDEKNIPKDLTTLLGLSKEIMQKIGNPFNSFRYFSNPEHNRVVFRSYIDGFPVFYNEKSGDVSLSWQRSTQSFYFSNSTLEVPISTSQNTITLESTSSLIQKLNNQGISTDKIQDIQIGYSWTKNQDSSEVVNLLPKYFVKINGTYKDASTLISHNVKGE